MGHKATSLGIMSGSSLDGLDLCLSQFSQLENKWTFEILETKTVELSEKLKKKLSESPNLQDDELLELDVEYGEFIGKVSREMASKAEVIGLHGHTVFHSPIEKISLQIGSSEIVAKIARISTVGNFRMKDVLLGGQGAPLVPMGEKHLFPEYDGFINLGGICNATFRKNNSSWIAGDIGPFNQVFNFYSEKLGHNFDKGGELARAGNIIPALINQWRDLNFFNAYFPKSLGNDWVENNFFGLNEKPEDVLASFAELISDKLANQLNQFCPSKVMVTGGGAWNSFLMESIRDKTNSQLIIPEAQLVDFKEALIFGFLGLLRTLEIPNVLSSCTGATKDSCSGDIYLP